MRYDPIALLTGTPASQALSYRGYYIVPARSAPGRFRVLDQYGQAQAPVGLLVFDTVGRAMLAIDEQVRPAEAG